MKKKIKMEKFKNLRKLKNIKLIKKVVVKKSYKFNFKNFVNKYVSNLSGYVNYYCVLYNSYPNINQYLLIIRFIFLIYCLCKNLSESFINYLADAENPDVDLPSSSQADQSNNSQVNPLYQERPGDINYDPSSFGNDHPANTQFYVSKLADNSNNIAEILEGTDVEVEFSRKNGCDLSPPGPKDLVSESPREVIVIRNATSLSEDDQQFLLENIKQGLYNIDRANDEADLSSWNYQDGAYYEEKIQEQLEHERQLQLQEQQGHDSGIESENEEPADYDSAIDEEEHDNDVEALEIRTNEFYENCKRDNNND